MDTPERNQIGTSISKFEDSPVFNYINSLSPIKPVKSVHITQTFNTLSFPSPPSVFTSPHVNAHRESRFVRRHNHLDASKTKVVSEDGNKISSSEEDSTHAYSNSEEKQGNSDERISVGDASSDPSNEQAQFIIELPQTLKYDCGSPSYDHPPCSNETSCLVELPGTSEVVNVHETSKIDSTEDEASLEGMCQIGPKTEGTECDWVSLMSDAADLLIFNSPNETEAFRGVMQKSLDHTVQFCNAMSQLPETSTNNGRRVHIVNPDASSSDHDIEEIPYQPGIDKETDQTGENLANVAVMPSNMNDKMDNELLCVTYRGLRRRCLDFEMAAARRKNSDDGSNTGSSTSQSEERYAANNKQLLPTKRSGDSQRCILPGIGFHLNALATLKDCKSVKTENLSSGRRFSLPSSASSLQLSTGQERPPLSSISACAERGLDAPDPNNGVLQPAEDSSEVSAYVVNDDFNQNSPKKKRRKLEPAAEGESCKRCNCKKSKCLKLYCECFAAGVYCIEPCSCQDCFNKPIHEDTVLATRKQIESRNPLAFAPKVIRTSDSVPEEDPNKTPASARHKRGCNCKKSNCLKKYCECYQGGVGCSISCRCEGCKNAYGRKDGSAPIEAEHEEETEATEKGEMERASQKTVTQNEEDHPDSALPTTPLRLSRPLIPLPFSSKGKPPRSSFITTISASRLYGSQKLGRPNIIRSQSNYEKPFQSVADDEMPEVLRGDGSPITCMKTSSPNGKRISSPNCDIGSSPARRSGRKLILQSIPSFPSLTPHH
ncbi:hypothetical protein L6164_025712 [Bauhinia variegata]|uniref:Uncharacterized protein n=1 Tax=Bauhinia variegata TaxID=167791 RepID=A0ACB9M494_BAUVA|nr:hypothetical protein L6164_025712 [Bauhinia variegata]